MEATGVNLRPFSLSTPQLNLVAGKKWRARAGSGASGTPLHSGCGRPRWVSQTEDHAGGKILETVAAEVMSLAARWQSRAHGTQYGL